MLRGDIVKDDSGAYALFTDQGSSASQMTAAKVMDVIARLPDCDGQAADALCAYTRVNWRTVPDCSKFQCQNVQTYWYVFHDIHGQNLGGNTLEPDRKPKVIYTDNSSEFGKACEDLSWNHCTSTPHRSETNGIAERAVRRVKESTSAVLLQSGLNESWWADSMECYTYLRNVTDLLSDGKTPYERRFGQPFEGPIIPFGSLVEYHPITAKDQSRIHQFGKKVLPVLFPRIRVVRAGIWKGNVLVADLQELETMDASEIYSKRLNAKEVIFPKESGEFTFPIADGRIKLSGGDQELRTSTLMRERPIRGESHVDFLGESEGSLPQPHDSFPDAGEAMNDFWSVSGNFIYRHHVDPRVKLYLPREESLPIPLKYIDVSRNTQTNLDVMQESRIDFLYRCVKRFVWLSDRFHSMHSIGRKTSKRIYVVLGGDWQGSSWHPGQIIDGQKY